MSDQLSLVDAPRTPSDARDCWRTPPELFATIMDRWPITCDVACDDSNCLVPDGHRLKDALCEPWPRAGWCWCNPPFSRLPEFMSRVCGQVDAGSRVVCVVPGHRHEQDWWHHFVIGRASQVLFPDHRIAYVPPPGIAASTPAFPSVVLVYWQGTDHRTTIGTL